MARNTTQNKTAGQYSEFVSAARDLGADVPEEQFNAALKKVASAPPAPMEKPKPKKRAKRKVL